MKKKAVMFAVLAVFALSVMSCARRETLRIFNWAYYTPESVIRLFEQEYNVRVTVDIFTTNEEMFASLKAGGARFDITFPSIDYVQIMMEQGMLERLDRSLLPNLVNIDPVILQKMAHDPNMDYAVPYFWGAAGIAVNTARVPDFEKCWSIFSRTDLRGRMTMLDDMREVMGNALSFLGYSTNSTDPREIEAARDLIINEWRPNLVRFDGSTYGFGFANGEFWVVHAYAEDIFYYILGDEQLFRDTVFFIPQRGSIAFIDSMVIPRGARNVELAHKFINFIHRPEIYAKFVSEFGLPATVNVPARDLVTGPSWYTLEDIVDLELSFKLGPALEYFQDAWFNSIRLGN